MVLIGVKAGSRGERAGLRTGDIVKGVNRAKIKNLADYTRITDPLEPGETIAFLIKRPNSGYRVVKVVK